MLVNVLLYEIGTSQEGIHTIEILEKTVVLMFEEKDDAERYAGLLEAQDFPKPTVELIERDEVEKFCSESGYEAKIVEKGFIPKTDHDRVLISPPLDNLDVTNWIDEDNKNKVNDEQSESELNKETLDNIKKRLENLL